MKHSNRVDNRWADDRRRAAAPPHLGHRPEIRKSQWFQTSHICCHGWDGMLKVSRVGLIRPWKFISHSESWAFIPEEQWAFITSLYIITPVYPWKKPVTLWNRAKNVHLGSTLVGELSLGNLGDNEDKRGDVYMVLFFLFFLARPCEGVCSHHCYSNPYAACSMSRVCISSAYVSDWGGAMIVCSRTSSCCVFIGGTENACISVYFRPNLHACVCVSASWLGLKRSPHCWSLMPPDLPSRETDRWSPMMPFFWGTKVTESDGAGCCVSSQRCDTRGHVIKSRIFSCFLWNLLEATHMRYIKGSIPFLQCCLHPLSRPRLGIDFLFGVTGPGSCEKTGDIF